jgi:hypothetical protein
MPEYKEIEGGPDRVPPPCHPQIIELLEFMAGKPMEEPWALADFEQGLEMCGAMMERWDPVNVIFSLAVTTAGMMQGAMLGGWGEECSLQELTDGMYDNYLIYMKRAQRGQN